MFFVSIFKREKRRKVRDRRSPDDPDPNDRRKIINNGRRAADDRRKDTGRRTGLYYKLPDDQKGTVDTIINLLEKKLER